MAEGITAEARGTKVKAESEAAEAPRKVQRMGVELEEGSQERPATCEGSQERPAACEGSQDDLAASSDVGTISDRRLQMEVQAILATKVQDLGQVTVGQMRSKLEQRLGLDGGALGARKQLRRRVSRVLQDEVVKKTGRSADCDRIVRALVEFEAYPAEVRQMLIEGLPHAVQAIQPGLRDEGDPPELHSHQVRLLGIVRDALGEARGHTASMEAASAARVVAAEAELSACRASCASATAAEIAAQAQFESAEARERNLDNEVEHAMAQLSAAEARVQGAGDQVAVLQSRRSIAVVLQDGPLKALLQGIWQDDGEGDAAVSAVLPYLREENADEALLAAAPASLRKRPNQRSAFDSLTVQSVKEFVAAQISAIESELAAGIESMADADRLAAAAMLRATRVRAANQASKVAAARSDAEEAAHTRRTAEADLARHRMGTIDLFRELEHLRAKVEELDNLVAMIDSWIAHRRLDGGRVATSSDVQTTCTGTIVDDPTLTGQAQLAEQSPSCLDDSTACLPASTKSQTTMCMPGSPQKAGSGEFLGAESEESSPARLRHIATPTRAV